MTNLFKAAPLTDFFFFFVFLFFFLFSAKAQVAASFEYELRKVAECLGPAPFISAS